MADCTILIVEDEKSIRAGLEDDLVLEGYDVCSAESGEQGLHLALERKIDLIILDIMLPGMDGMELCSKLRSLGKDTPVIFLTAKDRVDERVQGLERGADDYITKPFSPAELMARVRAILRRTGTGSAGGTCHFGDVQVDFDSYKVLKSGNPVHLTSSEFAVLRLFVRNPSRVMDRDRILDQVWGADVYVTPRTVDTHVAHLRKKIETDPAHPRYILSIHGVGYKFEPEGQE
jgi:DNA-binding response OmpR family regulator